MTHSYSIAIHGGAGTISKASMTPELKETYMNGLSNSIQKGVEILAKGGDACKAVAAAVVELENNPIFNAGRGAVFTHDMTHELDAAIMDGKTLNAGAVAGVKRIKNPILLASAIMNESSHILMLGEGAEAFAKSIGMEWVENDYFSVEHRRKQLLQIRDSDKTALDHSINTNAKKGTVGCVARDKHGNLAAATSTGGMTNKRYGRIGDTALIGAGTYANNAVCAISATGWGEFFMRGVVAYDIAALMMYKGLSLDEASYVVIKDKLGKLPPIDGEYGDGGIIGVDAKGNLALVFNSEGMYRASVKEGEEVVLGIY